MCGWPDGRITAVGPTPPGTTRADREIDAGGGYLLPGFVQTHLHLCQTLFRGLADDLAAARLAEAARLAARSGAHAGDAGAPSARLAVHELLRTGTTTVLTMETVHDTDAVLEALAPDGDPRHGRQVPDGRRRRRAGAAARERGARGLDASLDLRRRWHGHANGRIRIALAPRFAVSCTRDAARSRGRRVRGLGAS